MSKDHLAMIVHRTVVRTRLWVVASIAYFCINEILRESNQTAIVQTSTSFTKGQIERPMNQSEKYLQQQHRVNQVCQKYGLDRILQNDSSDHLQLNRYQINILKYKRKPDLTLLYNQEYRLTYCWIHKVASSTWNKIFFKLAGITKVSSAYLHTAAQLLCPNSSQLEDALSDESLRFLFVRHPFERLVSAFVDKFELGNKRDYIFRTFNPGISSINGLPHTTRPSFSQFVNYLLATDPINYNDHWIPYWLHCHLCTQQYDIMGRLETLSEDRQYIAESAKLPMLDLPWENNLRKKAATNIEYTKYFEQLQAEKIERLYEIYRIDFEMFNYSASDYLSHLS